MPNQNEFSVTKMIQNPKVKIVSHFFRIERWSRLVRISRTVVYLPPSSKLTNYSTLWPRDLWSIAFCICQEAWTWQYYLLYSTWPWLSLTKILISPGARQLVSKSMCQVCERCQDFLSWWLCSALSHGTISSLETARRYMMRGIFSGPCFKCKILFGVPLHELSLKIDPRISYHYYNIVHCTRSTKSAILDIPKAFFLKQCYGNYH